MTKRQRNACKLFADDVRRSLEKYTNTGISAYNYNLAPSESVIAELRAMLPDVEISARGFMGYVHFERKSGRENADRTAGAV